MGSGRSIKPPGLGPSGWNFPAPWLPAPPLWGKAGGGWSGAPRPQYWEAVERAGRTASRRRWEDEPGSPGRGAGRGAPRDPSRGPAQGPGGCACGWRPFTDPAAVPVCGFCTLSTRVPTPGGAGAGFLGSHGERPPSPAPGRRRVGHFSRLLRGQPAWPPRGAAFRDAGLGRSKGRRTFTPAPPGSPALGHLPPAREPHTQDKQSPQGNPGKPRAAER